MESADNNRVRQENIGSGPQETCSVVLTVDVEDWYHAADLGLPMSEWGGLPRRVESNTRMLLDLFEEYAATGTFFVLGCVALEYPNLVREIVRRGHELASHGTNHQMLTRLSAHEIRDDIARSKCLLEDIAGVEVTAYRAPSWTIEPTTYDVLDILEDLGFHIDSSVQPFHTPLSGIRDAPLAPFCPVINGRRLGIVEWPTTVATFAGVRIPFSGGLYLRTWPTWVSKRLFRSINQHRTPMMYLHPWEFDPEQPRLINNSFVRFTHYSNLGRMRAKLTRLLDEFSYHSLSSAVAALSEVGNVVLSPTYPAGAKGT